MVTVVSAQPVTIGMIFRKIKSFMLKCHSNIAQRFCRIYAL